MVTENYSKMGKPLGRCRQVCGLPKRDGEADSRKVEAKMEN